MPSSADSSAISQASSGSNGSPAIEPASRSMRAGAVSASSSSTRAAATVRGTPASIAMRSPDELRAGSSRRAGELQRVERVAAALAEDRRVPACRELATGEDAAFLLAERAELEHRDRRRGQRRAQSRGRPSRAVAEREQDMRRHAPAHEGGDELDRRGVAPVQVVEHEDERVAVRRPAPGVAGRRDARDGARRRAPWRATPFPARSDGRTPATSDRSSESAPTRPANSCEAT